MRIHTKLLASTAVAAALFAVTAVEAGKTRVLIITGDDVEPAHNWREYSAATLEVLQQSKKFDVTLVEKISVLDDAKALKKFDVIYFMMYNAKTPDPSPAGKANLLNFVKKGKGFVVSHLASASFKDWAEFKALCGRYWVMGKSGHGPRSVFQAKVVDTKHPITKGVTDFSVDDELYAKLEGNGPIQLLVTADSDWSKKTEPLAFTCTYGKGRVFHHTFGHDGKAIHTPMVEKLIVQGTAWAAKK